MLKDMLRMKEIYNQARLVTATIITDYTIETDKKINEGKKYRIKAEKQVDELFDKWKILVVDIQTNMNLGFYGKARLCKRIQNNLLELGYKTDSTVYIIEKLISLLTRKNKPTLDKPDYAEAYYNLGNLLLSQDRNKEAFDSYKKALAIKPDYSEAQKIINERF